MIKSEISYVWIAGNRDAKFAAESLDERQGKVRVNDFEEVDDPRDTIFLSGDGYQHQLTRYLVKKTAEHSDSPISYVHIDGHDDLASDSDDDDNRFKSFVTGISRDLDNRVYLLREGLTGEFEDDQLFFQPKFSRRGRPDWSAPIGRIQTEEIYLSIDVDVLDYGINHLFPQTPIGFEMSSLLRNVETLAKEYEIVAADIVGYSTRDINDIGLEESASNLATLAEWLKQHMGMGKA